MKGSSCCIIWQESTARFRLTANALSPSRILESGLKRDIPWSSYRNREYLLFLQVNSKLLDLEGLGEERGGLSTSAYLGSMKVMRLGV